MSDRNNKVEDIPVTPSSGNVFADLGFPNAEEELFRADLIRQIIQVMRQRRLTQARTATILGVSQSNVSHLVHGHYEDFSIDRLLRFLSALGVDVEVVLTPTESERGGTRVRLAS
jgi:predicted XRE-type DNA-binding protein